MRPNHNNKRMRGRHNNNNNNNRKPSNPLARSYESNGPDVKVRGAPQHIVEKYSQLARDAQVAGDPVLAEAYLQHAEHYYRIITAAHAAIAQAQGLGRPDAEVEEEGDDEDLTGMQQPYPDFRQQQQALQQQRQDAYASEQPPVEGGQPFPPRDRPVYQDRGDRQNFGDRQPFVERQDRGPRPERGPQDRGPQDRGPQDRGGQDRGPQDRGGERGDRRFPARPPREDFRPRRPEPEVEDQPAGLPSFITRPVNGEVEADAVVAQTPPTAPTAPVENGENGEGRFPYRARRRRRGAPADAAPGDEAPASPTERPEDQPAE